MFGYLRTQSDVDEKQARDEYDIRIFSEQQKYQENETPYEKRLRKGKANARRQRRYEQDKEITSTIELYKQMNINHIEYQKLLCKDILPRPRKFLFSIGNILLDIEYCEQQLSMYHTKSKNKQN